MNGDDVSINGLDSPLDTDVPSTSSPDAALSPRKKDAALLDKAAAKKGKQHVGCYSEGHKHAEHVQQLGSRRSSEWQGKKQ